MKIVVIGETGLTRASRRAKGKVLAHTRDEGNGVAVKRRIRV